MSENWYYSRDNASLGPVSAVELKRLASSGKLGPTDLVWKEGMRDWVAAEQLKGLFDVPVATLVTEREEPARAEPARTEPAQELITCQGCPRCEGDHRQFPIKKLSRPTFDGFTHWGVCPATGDPVLFNFKGTKGQH